MVLRPGVDVDGDGVKEAFDPTATDATGMFWLNRDPRFYDIIVYNGAEYPLNGMPDWFPRLHVHLQRWRRYS